MKDCEMREERPAREIFVARAVPCRAGDTEYDRVANMRFAAQRAFEEAEAFYQVLDERKGESK